MESVHSAGILIVDDEEFILTSLKRLTRKLRHPVFTATNPLVALEILKQHEISTIISDFNMPEMDGIRFLRESIKIKPNTLRIMLSGHAVAADLLNCINDQTIHHFMNKPWVDGELIKLIQHGQSTNTTNGVNNER